MDDPRALLHDLPVLQFVPPAARTLVVDSFVPVTVDFGRPIVTEGEVADAFYVLVSGTARVLKAGDDSQEISLNILRPGDSFGEIALLEEATRMATVRASSEVTVLRLDRSVFHALVHHHPEIRTHLELQIKHRHLHNFFRVYSAFARLPVEALKILVTELEMVEAAPGKVVIQEGDEPGPMYVVEEGRLRVFTEMDGHRRYLRYLRRGDFFGEMSVFKSSRRTASVEAVAPCRLLGLTAATFQKLLDNYPEFRAGIEARIAQYDYKEVARVPLDFAEELLPADVRAHDKVGPDQVDEDVEEEVEEPFASAEGHFVKSGKRIRRFPVVRQIDEADCGAAALAMVCRHFGRAVSLARIRQLVHTSIDGTSLSALCRAASELGLAARSVKASPRTLDDMPLPAVVHWEGNHWVVAYDVDRRRVRVADPALGLRRFAREEF